MDLDCIFCTEPVFGQDVQVKVTNCGHLYHESWHHKICGKGVGFYFSRFVYFFQFKMINLSQTCFADIFNMYLFLLNRGEKCPLCSSRLMVRTMRPVYGTAPNARPARRANRLMGVDARTPNGIDAPRNEIDATTNKSDAPTDEQNVEPNNFSSSADTNASTSGSYEEVKNIDSNAEKVAIKRTTSEAYASNQKCCLRPPSKIVLASAKWYR